MSNPGLGFKGAILGIGEETEWGTKVTPTKFVELNTDGIKVDEEHLYSEAKPGLSQTEDDFAPGPVTVSGDDEIEMRYEGMELFLKHAMGGAASVETASFVVDDTNNKIDFNIGAGELTGTLVNGTYIAGATQATAASMCKMIYDAIVAAEGAGTYTVSFSTATKKFTATRSAGVFVILWLSGANTLINCATLVGYSKLSDDTGGLTYTSDVAVVPVYTHTFTLADDLPIGLTLETDRDLTAFTANGGKINTLGLSIESTGFMKMSVGFAGKDFVKGAPTTPQTLPTAPLVVFSEGVITYGGASTDVITASMTLNNGLKTDRRFIGSRLIKEPQRSVKIEVTGTITVDFETTSQYDDFRAATSRAIVLIFTSTRAIKTGIFYTLTVTFPIIKLTAGCPKVSDEGPISLELPFKALALDSSNREFNIVLKNGLTSV